MGTHVWVLGTAQDGGVPHAGCSCATCAAARSDPNVRRSVASIALVGACGKTLVVDVTPDFPEQAARLAEVLGRERILPDALLLTHAHVGHYLGLASLGREAMNAPGVPVYVSASMRSFLETNRPWAWLVERGQIVLRTVTPEESFHFHGFDITPFLSPHRGEDTDTLGLEVGTEQHRLLYVPDADGFPPDLASRICAADTAIVDGTFYSPEELPGRDLSEIPHPFVGQSLGILAAAKGEVYFTHLNHSNPLLAPDPTHRPTLPDGFSVLEDGATFEL